MRFEYVPLLRLQRDLYRLPLGMGRFQAYLDEMVDPEAEDLRLPLVSMNPMAKEHVPAYLDRLISLDADAVAALTVANFVSDGDGETVRVALVAVDDVAGGWTNRFACEFGVRFGGDDLLERGWLPVSLWVSELEPETVREAVLSALERLEYVAEHGPARTLHERMTQEGTVMARAGCTSPTLDAEDSEYTRVVIEPFLDADDMRTAIEVLFGDAAGATLGFTPRGLSPWAGLALALHDARLALRDEVLA